MMAYVSYDRFVMMDLRQYSIVIDSREMVLNVIHLKYGSDNRLLTVISANEMTTRRST